MTWLNSISVNVYVNHHLSAFHWYCVSKVSVESNKSHLNIALFLEQPCSFKALIYSNFHVPSWIMINQFHAEVVRKQCNYKLPNPSVAAWRYHTSLHFCITPFLLIWSSYGCLTYNQIYNPHHQIWSSCPVALSETDLFYHQCLTSEVAQQQLSRPLTDMTNYWF